MSDPDAVVVSLADDLEQMSARLEDGDRSVHQLWAAIELMLDLLEHHGVVKDGHRRVIKKIRDKSPALRATVRLRQVGDKYAVKGPDIDCESRLHLCNARCCALAVELSRQDLEEGRIRFDIDEPYVMLRGADGYCSYLDRSNGHCVSYETRPAMCRQFDCRNDKRVWRDFEAREPAPMWHGSNPLELPEGE